VAKFLCDLCGRGSGSSRSLEQQIFEHWCCMSTLHILSVSLGEARELTPDSAL
jgi:hypothetical protein